MSYIQSPSLIKNPFFEIKITHLPTNQLIVLPGWVTQFSDNFTSNWNPQNVYGRMDPLVTFENTQRQITLAFDVVSANIDEAIANLANVNRLIEFLYPVYENSAGPNNARTIQNVLNAAPLIGLEWTNLVSRPGDGTKLVGFLRGANYSPEITEGGFVKGTKQIIEVEGEGEMNLDTNAVESQLVRGTTTKKAFIPKKLNVSLDYTVLHTHLTGWYKDADGAYIFGDNSINGGFPNAHMITYQQEETFQVTTTQDGTTTEELVGEPSELEQVAQADVLRAGS
jgi:hypothetical protein